MELRARDYNGVPMPARVAIVRCPSYAETGLREAVGRSLELSGGLDGFVRRGTKVFLKINHLSPGSPPERAIVTHPLFTKQVVALLKDQGADVTVGDDIPSNHERGFEVSGYDAMCREMGVRLLNLRSAGFREVPCPGGAELESVHIAAAALEADLVVNLPKLKTHSLTAYTGAVKNMFGTIPCGRRYDAHSRFTDHEAFGRMLVDVFSCIPPRLTLMDAVTAMEGAGPSAGRPRALGLVLASRDAVALDAVAQSLIGFGAGDVATTREAARRGLGTADLEAIEVVGETLEEVRPRRFRKPALPVGLFKRRLPASVYGLISAELILRPTVIPDACTGCGDCVAACFRSAVALAGGRASIRDEACIQCLCCHEVCRVDAIRLRQRPVGRAVRFLSSLFGVKTGDNFSAL